MWIVRTISPWSSGSSLRRRESTGATSELDLKAQYRSSVKASRGWSLNLSESTVISWGSRIHEGHAQEKKSTTRSAMKNEENRKKHLPSPFPPNMPITHLRWDLIRCMPGVNRQVSCPILFHPRVRSMMSVRTDLPPWWRHELVFLQRNEFFARVYSPDRKSRGCRFHVLMRSSWIGLAGLDRAKRLTREMWIDFEGISRDQSCRDFLPKREKKIP